MILFVVDALLLRVVVVVVALFPKPKLVLMLLLGRGLMPPRGRPPLLLLIVVVEHDFAFARDYCFVIITSCCFLCIAKVMPMARIQVNINNRNVV